MPSLELSVRLDVTSNLPDKLTMGPSAITRTAAPMVSGDGGDQLYRELSRSNLAVSLLQGSKKIAQSRAGHSVRALPII